MGVPVCWRGAKAIFAGFAGEVVAGAYGAVLAPRKTANGHQADLEPDRDMRRLENHG